MSVPGLPPLPKSLSTVDGSYRNIPLAINRTAVVNSEKHTNIKNSNPNCGNLDNQLAVLQREMYGLRQLDLSLLSQLWSLNESIQEYQNMLQEQDTLSPPSPSPSDINSISSDCDEELTLSSSILMKANSPQQLQHPEQQQNIYQSITQRQIRPILQQRMRGAPPPPPPARKGPQRPV